MCLDADAAVEAVYRSDWGRIVAALIRLVGDFEMAEEAARRLSQTPLRSGARPAFRSFRARGSSRRLGIRPSTASAVSRTTGRM